MLPMKKMPFSPLVACLVLLSAASTCSAQMYALTDLVQPNDAKCALAGGAYYTRAVNAFGQVVGTCQFGHYPYFGFRTAPNRPINADTDDLGALSSGAYTEADDINLFGQAVGSSQTGTAWHAFRTRPERPINTATDDLGTLGGTWSWSFGVNAFGQAVGLAYTTDDAAYHAFRTRPERPINAATDDLGTLGGTYSQATGINLFGQVIGYSNIAGDTVYHAFRTGPNRSINSMTDDLGTFGGTWSRATGVNLFGFTVGWAEMPGDAAYHAFRAEPNRPINPATDDLGTLGGTDSQAAGINAFGQIVGWAALSGDSTSHAFLYSGHTMHDLNDLIQANSGCELYVATSINDAGQIVGNGSCNGQYHAVLLTPIYRAFIWSPVEADGSSVFSRKRGIVSLKFTLTAYGVRTCTLPPATIAMTKAAGDTLSQVDLSDNEGLQIDPIACQYVYSLEASSLDTGTYLADVSIGGISVGHAVFGVK
jgi:probable HAF family extracellular repeat protein